MRSDLPALQALLAFDAVSRHLSFTRAAQELSVTPGAVSHQIRGLEAFVGVALLARTRQSVALTPAGTLYLSEVRAALHRLAEATRELRGARGHTRLAVEVLPSLASRWLLPRLSGFMARHPAVDLRISASQEPVTPGPGGPDLCIRYGRGPWPGVKAEPLCAEQLYPVCAPGVASQRELRQGMLPRGLPLLRDAHEPWQDWFAAAGQPASGHRLGPRFDNSALMLQAAEQGQGIALARHLLVQDALARGELVRIGNVAIASRNAYSIVTAAPAELPPSAQSFCQWLRSQLPAG